MQQVKKILNNQICSWIRFHFYFDVLIIFFSEAFHYVNFEMFDVMQQHLCLTMSA